MNTWYVQLTFTGLSEHQVDRIYPLLSHLAATQTVENFSIEVGKEQYDTPVTS
jgi:hypothetical protein